MRSSNLMTCLVNTKLPQASIGMPVYNGAEYICDALDSLLAQSYTDFEIIISDNASTDETESLCRKYVRKDQRIKYMRQEFNIGAAANFEFVLAASSGKYFMWAAHDDVWSKRYLFNSISLLSNEKISFAFPTFELKSIQLYLAKRINKSIFEFIESKDARVRVLQFLALHHSSHKCNIVYSLFRIDFIKEVYKLQNIKDDGALGALILKHGQGKMVEGALFSKRYSKFWPGALNWLYFFLFKDSSENFLLEKEKGLSNLLHLFPEYADEIKVIFDRYKPYRHLKSYLIYHVS